MSRLWLDATTWMHHMFYIDIYNKHACLDRIRNVYRVYIYDIIIILSCSSYINGGILYEYERHYKTESAPQRAPSSTI